MIRTHLWPARQYLTVDVECDPARVVPAQQIVERRIEQRLEVKSECFF